MSTNVPNLKQIGGGHRKNGQKCVDLMWNDPQATVEQMQRRLVQTERIKLWEQDVMEQVSRLVAITSCRLYSCKNSVSNLLLVNCEVNRIEL